MISSAATIAGRSPSSFGFLHFADSDEAARDEAAILDGLFTHRADPGKILQGRDFERDSRIVSEFHALSLGRPGPGPIFCNRGECTAVALFHQPFQIFDMIRGTFSRLFSEGGRVCGTSRCLRLISSGVPYLATTARKSFITVLIGVEQDSVDGLQTVWGNGKQMAQVFVSLFSL